MKNARNRRRDISMDDPRLKALNAFGGILLRKARYRTKRPLCTKRAVHVVLRSSQARGTQSFQYSKNWKKIEQLCHEFAKRYGIKLHHYANGGSHLHLVIKIKSRTAYSNFIRALTGAIALKITGATRNQGNNQRFWDFRPFTQLANQAKPQNPKNDYVTLTFLRDLNIIPNLRTLIHSSA